MVISIALLFLLLVTQSLHAQTVSIVSTHDRAESLMVQAAMTHALREEGYIVKSDTTEGIVFMLQVMKVKNSAGEPRGFVGYMNVLTTQWPQFADGVVSDAYKEDHAVGQHQLDRQYRAV